MPNYKIEIASPFAIVRVIREEGEHVIAGEVIVTGTSQVDIGLMKQELDKAYQKHLNLEQKKCSMCVDTAFKNIVNGMEDQTKVHPKSKPRHRKPS